MKCLACEWQRQNITRIDFCPTCGLDLQLTKLAKDN